MNAQLFYNLQQSDTIKKQSERIAQLEEALKNAVARMEENKPQKAKKRDLNAVYRNAIFYRDLQAARNAIAKATE